MSQLHAREQVLDYVVNLITEKVIINCVKHRKGPREQYKTKHVEVSIDDETTDGDNGADEAESTLDSLSRIAPMFVTVTVKDPQKPPETDANNLCGFIEEALAGEDENDDGGDGDHVVNGAPVSLQYATTVREDDDTLEADMCQYVMVFQASYRTRPGKPFTLI